MWKAFHKICECVAVGIVNPIKIGTKKNIADFLTKALAWKELHYHAGVFFGRWDLGDEVDMMKVKLRA